MVAIIVTNCDQKSCPITCIKLQVVQDVPEHEEILDMTSQGKILQKCQMDFFIKEVSMSVTFWSCVFSVASNVPRRKFRGHFLSGNW